MQSHALVEVYMYIAYMEDDMLLVCIHMVAGGGPARPWVPT